MKRFPAYFQVLAAALCLAVGIQTPVRAADETANANWHWEKNRAPFALLVKGIWWEYFKPYQALDDVGFRVDEEFKNLPRYSVIVLANVQPGRLPAGALEKIRDFVQQGGGLVVLGGLGSYANTGYQERPILVDMLPVDMKESYIEFYPTAEKGAKLAKAEKSDWPLKVDFSAGPNAFYFHTLIPKSDARVQVNVGDKPAFVCGRYGKGRVVACSLTVNGEAPAGTLAFWDWKDWPALLGQACAWAGGGRPAGEPAAKVAAATGGPKPLTEDDIRSAELGLSELPKDFAVRALLKPDAKLAQTLFDLSVSDKDDAKVPLNAVLPALLPYAKPEWGPRLKSMTEETNPNLDTRRAALVLTGACRNDGAYPILVRGFNNEKTALAAIDGLGRLGDARAIPVLKEKFNESLRPARLPDGPHRFSVAPFVDGSLPASYSALALYRLGDKDGVTRLFEFSRDLDLYARVVGNSTKRQVREGDTQGAAIVAALYAYTKTLYEGWTYLYENIGPIPPAQSEAFVKFAATVDDPFLIEWMIHAMEKSDTLPKTTWQGLTSAKSGGIAKYGQSLAAGE